MEEKKEKVGKRVEMRKGVDKPMSGKRCHATFACNSQVLGDFWATVCKTVRPMLSVRCLSCLSVLSVTLVYCGQMVGRIKIKPGMQVDLRPGHTVLDGDPAPPSPKRG